MAAPGICTQQDHNKRIQWLLIHKQLTPEKSKWNASKQIYKILIFSAIVYTSQQNQECIHDNLLKHLICKPPFNIGDPLKPFKTVPLWNMMEQGSSHNTFLQT